MWFNPLHFVSPDVQIEQSQVKAQPSLNRFCLSGVEANLWESIFLSIWGGMSFKILLFLPFFRLWHIYVPALHHCIAHCHLNIASSHIFLMINLIKLNSQTNLFSSLDISYRSEFHLLGVDWLHGARPSAVWRTRVVCQGKAGQVLELWPQLKECWKFHL